jgi:hypothetical protein
MYRIAQSGDSVTSVRVGSGESPVPTRTLHGLLKEILRIFGRRITEARLPVKFGVASAHPVQIGGAASVQPFASRWSLKLFEPFRMRFAHYQVNGASEDK